jgi:hypothetical protein
MSVLAVLFLATATYQMALHDHGFAIHQTASIGQSCMKQCALGIAYLIGR